MLRILVLTMLFAGGLWAQNYAVTSGSLFSFNPVASPTLLPLGDDALSPLQSPSGFAFTYFGQSYNSFAVGSNGYITLNGATSGSIVLGGIPMASELLTRLSVSTAGRHILAASLQDLEPNGALNVDNVFANV